MPHHETYEVAPNVLSERIAFSEAELTEAMNAKITRAYRDAVQVQNASNPAGIIVSFREAVTLVMHDLEQHGPNAATRNVCHHPVFVLFASKLHDMASLGLSDAERYSLAYRFAEAVSHGALIVGADEYKAALAGYYEDWDADQSARNARFTVWPVTD